MKIIFDGKEFNVEDSSKNIVEIAKANGIYITAPCLYNKRENGCCNSCLILVDGIEVRACETTPVDGMEIIYDREDLTEKRTYNLERYTTRRNVETAVNSKGCTGSCSTGEGCDCGSH